MAVKVFEIDLDIKDPKFKLVSPIEVVSGDTDTNIFNIQIFENFVPVNASGNTVVIIFGKPDSTTVFQNLTVVDATKGQYTCTLSSQTIAVPGRIKAEVALYEGIKRLTSTRFEFNVRKAILDENTVESSNEFSALTQALSEVTDLKNLAGVGRTTENVKENADNIGDLTTLETTEKTNLVGAINEVKDDVDNIKLTADNVEYNNTESGLEAEDVQGAIDEVVDDLDSHLADITSQSVGKGASLVGASDLGNYFYNAKTVEQMLQKLGAENYIYNNYSSSPRTLLLLEQNCNTMQYSKTDQDLIVANISGFIYTSITNSCFDIDVLIAWRVDLQTGILQNTRVEVRTNFAPTVNKEQLKLYYSITKENEKDIFRVYLETTKVKNYFAIRKNGGLNSLTMGVWTPRMIIPTTLPENAIEVPIGWA